MVSEIMPFVLLDAQSVDFGVGGCELVAQVHDLGDEFLLFFGVL